MFHWKLTLSYDGTAFHGWQVQPHLPTVQGTLQQALAQLTGDFVLPKGAGRTDTGVHALGQVCSFSLTAPIPAPNLLRALNRALPAAIRVLAAEPVPADFHARRNVLHKTYEYHLFLRQLAPNTPDRICSPFLAPYVWDCRWPLALDPMHRAAAALCGTHDFTSFSAADPDLTHRSHPAPGRDPVKTLHTLNLAPHDGLLHLRFTGSGFLHHMVRNLVGTLVDVGRGALTPADIPRILAARDRAAAGPTAPPQGLFLLNVTYTDPPPGDAA